MRRRLRSTPGRQPNWRSRWTDHGYAGPFPAATAVASANAQLNRLQTTVNQGASEQGIALAIRITADKKAGAQGRWLWFEGGVEAPAPAYTGELNAVPPGGRCMA